MLFKCSPDSHAALKTTYEETYFGHTLTIPKRPDPNGDHEKFHKWDNCLTFEEIRAGRMRHREDKSQLLEALPEAA